VKIVYNSLVKNTSLLDYFLHYLMFCKPFLQKLQIEDNFTPICFQFCKPSGIFILVMQISVLPIQSNPVLLCRNLFQFNTSKKLLIHLNKKENEKVQHNYQMDSPHPGYGFCGIYQHFCSGCF